LYWPTGAGRWAFFFGLADGPTTAKIVAAAGGGESPPLVLSDEVRPAMRLLPPQPVGCRDCDGCDAPLWLLPLVDERFFWNRLLAGELTVEKGDAWSDLFDDLASEVGVSLDSDPVESAYLHPDPQAMSIAYDNPAALLDAAAHTVGQRVVQTLSGDTLSLNWSRSESRIEQNLAERWPLIRGGDASDQAEQTPALVSVAFRKIRHFVPTIRGETYTYEKGPAAGLFLPGALLQGAKERITSTAYADFTNDNAAPDNDSELDALAEQIAADYYASKRFKADATFAGFHPWAPSGYDDYILWRFHDDYGPVTEVHFDERDPAPLRHQGNRTIFDTTIKKGVADEAISADSSGDVSIKEDGVDIGENVDAQLNWMHNDEDISSGKEVLLQYFHEENAWVVIGAECED